MCRSEQETITKRLQPAAWFLKCFFSDPKGNPCQLTLVYMRLDKMIMLFPTIASLSGHKLPPHHHAATCIYGVLIVQM